MRRGVFAAVLATAFFICGCACALAADRETARAKGSPKDPVESAFALPGRIQLSAQQSESLQKVRKEFEPQLREALGKVSSASNDRSKLLAAKEVTRLRARIRDEMAKALTQSPEGNYEGKSEGSGEKAQGPGEWSPAKSNWGYYDQFGRWHPYWPYGWGPHLRPYVREKAGERRVEVGEADKPVQGSVESKTPVAIAKPAPGAWQKPGGATVQPWQGGGRPPAPQQPANTKRTTKK